MASKSKTPDVSKIKPAPYNPRKISEHQYNGLKTSMDKFGDISGITWNKKSNNLISGHQRWSKLQNDYSDLYLGEAQEDKHPVMSKEQGYTGFHIRVVDWDEATERAANIAANNHAIGGEWETELLSTLLQDAKDSNPELFRDLNFDILEHDLKLDFDKDWNSDLDGVGKVSSNLNGMPARIIIECEPDLKDEVLIYLKAKLMETSFEGVHIK